MVKGLDFWLLLQNDVGDNLHIRVVYNAVTVHVSSCCVEMGWGLAIDVADDTGHVDNVELTITIDIANEVLQDAGIDLAGTLLKPL